MRGDRVRSDVEAGKAQQVPELQKLALSLLDGNESPASVASAVEFVLEGLHLAKRLNKDSAGARATYRSRTTAV